MTLRTKIEEAITNLPRDWDMQTREEEQKRVDDCVDQICTIFKEELEILRPEVYDDGICREEYDEKVKKLLGEWRK